MPDPSRPERQPYDESTGRAILINATGEIDYETLRRALPPDVEPAYDGMELSVGL